MKISFNNSYAKLPAVFYRKTDPIPVINPALIKFNNNLAKQLGITEIDPDGSAVLGVLAGNEIPVGAEPVSMAYAGHQFGGFSPQLGDGRAVLLGEVISPDGIRYDLQLKGSGPTPWSRGGDGRSALGPVLREYLMSEAMHKLGVPTTRALAVVTTGEEVARDTLVPGGILTRVATGFVRVGTFEYFSARQDINAIKQLANYEIERHYPDALKADNPYAALLEAVIKKQAKLIAQWMTLGFIHGVMNTDNMSIAGETIDYGPCAFMDEFSHNRVFSSIDHGKRYAYNNQPKIGQWNLIRLAEALLPLFVDISLEEDKQGEAAVSIAQDILNAYEGHYKTYWLAGMRRKLGLSDDASLEKDDIALIEDLLDCMESNKADFTLTFCYLSRMSKNSSEDDQEITTLFSNPDMFDKWIEKWRDRLTKESSNEEQSQTMMQSVNPVYIPRNHQIEAAIRAAEDHNDFSLFQELHEVLQKPFETQADKEKFMLAPMPDEIVHQTFCGT